LSTAKHWEKVGRYPHHGICLPVSSLRTAKSSGIGEFLDLVPLIDWCKKVGFDSIQLLPINDSGHDTSPYNAMSSIALDPIYISLDELGIANPEDFAPLN
jgi:4-alpha-glucanotransferase